MPTFQGYMDAVFSDREDLKSTMSYLIKAASTTIM
jgi:hypothetical protein